jgi:hypothetical protein
MPPDPTDRPLAARLARLGCPPPTVPFRPTAPDRLSRPAITRADALGKPSWLVARDADRAELQLATQAAADRRSVAEIQREAAVSQRELDRQADVDRLAQLKRCPE